MSNSYVSLRKINLAYNKNIVVPDLDLDIHEGELITLLGPSGCGKTTTMRAIAGLMAPSSGNIYIDGKDVTNVTANKRGIGLVFQSYALFPHLNAFENVAFGLRLQKLAENEIKEKVEAGLNKVGLAHLTDRKPAEMSGGQQQRLSLARSLVMEPKVLLLDEPLSNLDARLRLDMRTELQRVQRDTGVTMIFVTHDQAEALALADRIVLMNDGLIEQIGTPDALYNRPKTKFAADFFGFENIFKIENGALVGKNSSVVIDFATDARYLAWRPSAVIINQGKFKAVVIGAAFAGEHVEYVLESKLGQIKVSVSTGESMLKIGDDINFDLPEQSACSLAS